MISLLRGNEYQRLLLVFDSGKKNFRHVLNKDYKVNRRESDLLLLNQLQAIQESLEQVNVSFIKLENYEADDLIASFISQNIGFKIKFDIFSQDKDLLQLLIPKSSNKSQINIYKYFDKKLKFYNYEDFVKEYNFCPANYVDYLSLVGDRVDNLDGVIGLKKAQRIIEQFSAIENLYQNIHKIRDPKIKKRLEIKKDLVLQNKQLILLKKDLVLPIDLEKCFFS